MILRDFETNANFWTTGVAAPTLEIHEINHQFFDFRTGWTGLAFTWNPFCVNVLQVGDKIFTRGWGMHCYDELKCRVNLPRPTREIEVQVGLNFSHSLSREKWETLFQIRDAQQNVLSEARVKYGELKKMHANLNGAECCYLCMKEIHGAGCPVDWLLPKITYMDGTVETPGERGLDPASLEIRFDYDGKPFDAASWSHSVAENHNRFFHIWKSPDNRLELHVEARIHQQFHVIELIPELVAAGTEPTELIDNFHVRFQKRIYDIPHNGAAQYRETAPLLQPEFTLHRNYGSKSTGTDFLPLQTRLAGRHGMNEVIMDTDEGRSSAVWLPFFQIELSEDRRLDFAVSWSGAWESHVRFIDTDIFEVTAGIHQTHLRLYPGEAIRQPGLTMHFAVANAVDCRNEFRQFMIECKLPRNSRGELLMPPAAIMFSGTMPNSLLLDYLNIVETYDLPLEVFWVDAGWYGPNREVAQELHQSDWGRTVGDWRVNQIPHPGGFRPVTDALHKAGRRFLLWAEPERVYNDTLITREHPEFLVAPPNCHCGQNYMLNLGNDKACDYVIDMISNLIESEGIDCYREDFNMNTLPYWQKMDEDNPERVGIAESRFVTGFYRFWHALRKRFPDLLIDNCSSGGRRIDLETLSLSIPLWRSDFQGFFDIGYLPESNQIQFDGLSSWAPFHTSGIAMTTPDDYAFFSGAVGAPLVDVCNRLLFKPEATAFDFAWLRNRLQIAIRMRSFLTGNYYRLTEHPEDFRNFFAYQLLDKEKQAGFVAVFRRAATQKDKLTLEFQDIIPADRYRLDAVTGNSEIPQLVTGKDLSSWQVTLPTPRSCQILFFTRIE